MPTNLENSAVATGLEKKSVFIPIPKKGNAEECSNYHTIVLISHASKVVLKILQARLQNYVNQELPNVQAGFRKGIGNQRSNWQHPLDHRKGKGIPEKHLFLIQWLHSSLWLCGSQQIVENSSRDGNIRPPYLSPEKPVSRSRRNRTEHGTVWFQTGKGVHKGWILSSWEMLGWMNHKLGSRLLGEISTSSDRQMIPL